MAPPDEDFRIDYLLRTALLQYRCNMQYRHSDVTCHIEIEWCQRHRLVQVAAAAAAAAAGPSALDPPAPRSTTSTVVHVVNSEALSPSLKRETEDPLWRPLSLERVSLFSVLGCQPAGLLLLSVLCFIHYGPFCR